MTSPFRSIYDHEKEHQLMLKNRGGDGLVKVFNDFDEFNNSGDELKNSRPIWIGTKSYWYNGTNAVSVENAIPTIYAGIKTATTTVDQQYEKLATGVTKLHVKNKDETNGVIIGLGDTASEAKDACSTGVVGVSKFLILPEVACEIRTNSFFYCAWLSLASSVSIVLVQGV